MLLSTVMAVIYFTFLAVPGMDNVYMNIRMNLTRYWCRNFDNTRWNPPFFFFMISADVFVNAWLITLAYVSLKNIEFKIYLWDLLYGRGLIRKGFKGSKE
jgi:uncharacterized membrane protein (DUF485 family)